LDSKTRQERQREFTIYLVLFILLVIVGAVGYNTQTNPNVYPAGPYGYMYGGWPMYGGYPVQGGPFGPGYGYSGLAYGGPSLGGLAPYSGGPIAPGWW
jgi:hypothetical protein